MGTDIFLYKKYRDFKNAKPVDSLRASFWSEKENAFLRMVFPEKFWIEENYDLDKELYATHGIRYEFTKEGLEILRKIGDLYLESYNSGSDFKEFESPFKDKVLEQFGMQGYTVVNAGSMDSLDSQYWFEELIEFYEEGLQLERKRLKPEVYINW